MKLLSIEIENYRSILKKQKITLDERLSVFIGPNNEGKSNLLRSIAVAMNIIIELKFRPMRYRSERNNSSFRISNDEYLWEEDFPRQLQKKNPNGKTKLRLEFKLSEKEKNKLKIQSSIKNNEILPIEITLGKDGGTFNVKKQGRSARTYQSKIIDILKFINEHFEFQYIPTIRTGKLSIQVVENLLERELKRDLSNEKINKEYSDALEKIRSIQEPIYERIANDIQGQIKKLLPSVKYVKLNQPKERVSGLRYRSMIRTPEFLINDGIETSLEAKGDGIKSLIAISLMRTTDKSEEASDFLVAIEEPESHLHPEAVRQLAEILKSISLDHQVIVTTHSSLLVSRSNINSNIIVNRSTAVAAKSIKAIRDSLGIVVSDNLSSAEFVILLEGKHDVKALYKIFCQRSELRTYIENGKLVFDDMGGVSKLGYLIQCLKHSVANPILIVDGDKGGRDNTIRATKDGRLDSKYIFSWTRKDHQETELEDLFDARLYWKYFCTELGATLDIDSFEELKEKWSNRFKKVYVEAGKTWFEDTENKAKGILAEWVSANPDRAIRIEYKELMDRIVFAVASIIENR